MTISNVAGSHPHSRGVPAGHPRISRFLGLPISVKERVVGMIGLANKFEPYTHADADFLQPLLDALAGLFYAVELEDARAVAEEKLRRLAMTDSLTGLYNRRAFVEKCQALTHEDKQVSVAVIDIDHFKNVNDTYGHDAGDQALIAVANLIDEFYVEPDIVSRLGGEEFAIVSVFETRDQEVERLNKLREAIEKCKVQYKKDSISLTISIGAMFVDSTYHVDFSHLLSQADKLLYQAKTMGRNRVMCQQ